MSPRELLDRQLRLVEAGDLEGILGQYHEDAVLVSSSGTHSGKPALREFFTGWLAQRPRPVAVSAFAAGEDVGTYQATMEIGGEEVRTYGTIVLRGERIWRHTTGLFPTAGGAARKGAVQVDLEPYTAWVSRPMPDPRTAGRETIGPVLLEIVAAEGPIIAGRAYRLYVKASGGTALTTIARAPLSGAAHRLRVAGAIEMQEGETPDDAVLRPAATAPVRVRELGPRALDEVPLEEIAELMRRLLAGGATDLPRAVLDTYGLVRMTAKAETYLAEARRLATAP
jgi:hypothetical protein